VRKTSMFMPNSPSPPRGIAKREGLSNAAHVLARGPSSYHNGLWEIGEAERSWVRMQACQSPSDLNMQMMFAFRGVEGEFVVEGPLVKTHPAHDPVTQVAAASLAGSVQREGVRLCGSRNSRSPYKFRPVESFERDRLGLFS
jgi:hypothetical protein